MRLEEGYIPFKGVQTWYRIVGEREISSIPLLILHGGPGSAHDYLESLDGLADLGRQIIYYDQLGCGKSSTVSQPDLWNVELWEEEIEVVRKALKLDEVHILGQSWGGMLAMQYAIKQPKGVKSMIIASSPASMKLWQQEAKRLINLLPACHKEAILYGEQYGEYNSVAYQAAYQEYYRRHVCKMEPYPDYIKRSMEQEGEVYEVMEGPSEFTVTGKLNSWDITSELWKITIPTLLTSGTDDEATPMIIKSIYDRIPNCRWELLEGSHMVHAEQKEKYNQLVHDFLLTMEQSCR